MIVYNIICNFKWVLLNLLTLAIATLKPMQYPVACSQSRQYHCYHSALSYVGMLIIDGV